MIPVPGHFRVWLAVGRTDMRRGMNGLALQVQEALTLDRHLGPEASDAQLRHLEGQRHLVSTILALVARGRSGG